MSVRIGALIRIGRLLTKTHSKGGAYLEGGAYWKEGAKSNHYGKLYVKENFSRKNCYNKAIKHEQQAR